MKSNNCIICNSSECKILFRKNEAQVHQIVKCKKCDLIYAYPQEKVILKECPEQKTFSPSRPFKQYLRKQYNQISDYKNIASFIEKIKPEKGKLLEIGANAGIFLKYLEDKGWDVVGIEPMEEYVAYAKEYFSINMLQTTIEESSFRDNAFDVAVMLHVIEHLSDPTLTLKILNRILKTGGLLVIETPKYDTVMFKIFRRRERSVSCNGHLYFFTRATLRRLVEQYNFEVIKEETVGRTLAMDRFLWNIGVISKNNFVRNTAEYLSDVSCFQKIKIYLNLGDMQRIYCRKR